MNAHRKDLPATGPSVLLRCARNACLLLNIVVLFAPGHVHAATSQMVRDGRAASLHYEGEPWTQHKDFIEASGQGRLALSELELGEQDATVRARLRIRDMAGSNASFFVGESQFIFEGKVAGPVFGEYPPSPTMPFATDGAEFSFEARRRGDRLSYWIDGKQVLDIDVHRGGALEEFGFRPGSATMQIYEWSADGSLVPPAALRRPPLMVDVFESNPGDVSMYRIPTLVTTNEGTLLAFAEARRNAANEYISDAGNIDLVVKRSRDGGVTWGPEEVVWDDGNNTCGNPCAVVDRKSGKIWLAMCWNLGRDHEDDLLAGENEQPRRVFITSSDDDGHTWSPPRDLTNLVKRSDWRWYATGPGRAIQLTRGPYAGRIVIPANHSDHANSIPEKFVNMEHPYYRSHVFYSDDGGANWKLGGSLGWATNESTIVELADGAIHDNVRSYEGKGLRSVAVSRDGGDSWSENRLHPQLTEPKCQGNLLRFSYPSDTEKSRILFVNPASRRTRNRLTVRASYDEGETWPVSAMIYRGSAAYSCLTTLADGSIGVLFERDDTRKMTFANFTIDWLEQDPQ